MILWTVVLSLVAGASGWFFFGGEDVPDFAPQYLKDRAALREWDARAANGDAEALYRSGRAYRDGLGTEANPTKAYRLLTRAARLGHIRAQLELGRMAAAGDGMPQDYFRAAEWFRLAASLGKDADAAFELGNLYLNGMGVGQDHGIAADWFTRAALAGHAGGQYILGAFEQEGWGRDRDLVMAHAWYALAAEQGDKALSYRADFDPLAGLKVVERRMNKAQMAEARTALAKLKKRITRLP
ncbi:MAG: tetratricopeptide repeat protein [Rhodospirillales bacterium]